MTQSSPNKAGGAGTKPVQNSIDSQVKNPDAVQKQILGGWHWVENNAGIVFGLAGLLLLGGIIWVVMNWMGDRKEAKAQEAYYAVESKFMKIKDGFDRAKYSALMPGLAGQTKAEDKAASGDLTKDYGALMTDLEKVARDHAGTAAGAQAAILAADTYLAYNQATKASELAQIPAKNMKAQTLPGSLARVVWGSSLAAENKCGEAVKVWQEVLDAKNMAYLHGDVSLRSGLCFESLNEPEKAKEMYRKVSAESADTAVSARAKGLLRALEQKAKTPPAAAQQG
jgi:hypothetical protein